MKNEFCPYCGEKLSKKYKYILDDLDVSTLTKIWKEVVLTKSNEINVSNIGLRQAERLRLTQLRFHALVAKVRNENGSHIPNTWLITKRGAGFLAGEISVPDYVITFRNKVINHSIERVNRRKFKVLQEFTATYEIIDGEVMPKRIKQGSMI